MTRRNTSDTTDTTETSETREVPGSGQAGDELPTGVVGDQRGVTLIEVLLVVAITAIIAVPVTGWLISTLQHQDAAQHQLRNAVGTGLLARSFSRDVASAAQLFAHPTGGDCNDPGRGAGEVLLSIVPSLSPNKVVYTQAPATGSAHGHQSLWRRECSPTGSLVSATEVFDRIVPGEVEVTCPGTGGSADGCGEDTNRRVRLKLTPCPTRPSQAAARCDLTGATQPADVELHATRRITPGYEEYAGGGIVAQIHVSPRAGYVGNVFTFDAGNSRVGEGATYSWDLGDGTTATGVVATHSFSQAGQHTVTLTVTDDSGATSSAIATVHVLHQSPVARITEVPTADGIYVDASGSSHPDNLPLSYHWTFGGGQEASGPYVKVPGAGKRRATLWVTDPHGRADTATIVIDRDAPPTGPIQITPVPVESPGKLPTVGSVGADLDPLEVTFRSDDGAAEWSWRLTRLGENTALAEPRGGEFVHVFGEGDAGEYEVVRLVPGGTIVGEPLRFRVNAAPRANFTVSPAAAGSVTTFRGEGPGGSTDSDGEIISWNWSFGYSGRQATGPNPSHIYEVPGTFIVTLTVTDDDGATAKIERPVQIPGAPSAPPPPRWSGSTVEWDPIPGAERYRAQFWCTLGEAPQVVEVAPSLAPSVEAPQFCEGGLVTVSLQVRVNGQWSMPSTQVARP